MTKQATMTSRKRIPLKITDPRLGTEFPLPTYATEGSAAVDLRAMIHETLVLAPGEVKLLPSGFAIHVEDPGLMAVIVPRSGLGHKHGLVLGNGTGILDADYTGEVYVSAFNRGTDPVTIQPGDRIAQMLIVPVVQVEFDVVDDLATTQRASRGFGSTGVR